MSAARPWMAILLIALVAPLPARADRDAAGAPAADRPPATSSTDDLWAAQDPAAAANDRTLRRGHANTEKPAATPVESRTSAAWWRTLLSLAGVVALIVLLGWGYRVAAGGRAALLGRGRHAGLLEVVSRTPIAPRQSVCLLRVGPRLVLIGVGPTGLRTLDVIADAELASRLSGDAARAGSQSRTAEFNRLLKDAASDFEKELSVDETALPEERRVLDLRERLAQALARVRARAFGPSTEPGKAGSA